MQPYFPRVFDSSMLATLKTCPQLFKKIYIDDWKSLAGANIHLRAGGAFAKGVEVVRVAFYEEGLSAEDSVAKGLAALLLTYGEPTGPADSDSAKTLSGMAGALVYYFDMYPLNHETAYPALLPGGKRGIEFSAAYPLPIDHPITGEPIIYCGRLDAINHYATGLWGFDEKTTSRMGPTWSKKWTLRGQLTGYSWLCEQSGIHLDGMVVRGVSILTNSYETQEAIVYQAEWQVARWYTETLEWISDAITWWKRKRFRYNLDDACSNYGGCGFLTVCSSQNEQGYLETYFKKVRWNPITREEVEL